MVKRLVLAIEALTTRMVVAPTASVHATVASVPRFPGKVYVIVGENTSLSQLTMKNAPYQLGTIKPAGAWLTDYWGISHYSTSNYIAMTSGQFLECHQLDEKPATCNQDVSNIFGQLQQAGISVKFDGGHVPFAVLGANVHPGSYDGFTNHYNLLRTLEDGFGLSGPPGASATAAPILQIWDKP